jgi:hypothetical protein
LCFVLRAWGFKASRLQGFSTLGALCSIRSVTTDNTRCTTATAHSCARKNPDCACACPETYSRGIQLTPSSLHCANSHAATTNLILAMSTSPMFWRQPFRYLRWASHEKPALFWSVAIGLVGPVMMAVVPPVRHRYGDGPRPPIPLTYPSESSRVPGGVGTGCWLICDVVPVPAGTRKIPEGYDD